MYLYIRETRECSLETKFHLISNIGDEIKCPPVRFARTTTKNRASQTGRVWK